jgi:hypothetical protein
MRFDTLQRCQPDLGNFEYVSGAESPIEWASRYRMSSGIHSHFPG